MWRWWFSCGGWWFGLWFACGFHVVVGGGFHVVVGGGGGRALSSVVISVSDLNFEEVCVFRVIVFAMMSFASACGFAWFEGMPCLKVRQCD